MKKVYTLTQGEMEALENLRIGIESDAHLLGGALAPYNIPTEDDVYALINRILINTDFIKKILEED